MNAWLSHVQLACAPHDARPYMLAHPAECLGCPCSEDPWTSLLLADLDRPARGRLVLPSEDKGNA